MTLRRLVDLAKMRWRVERDYEDLKQEIGLGPSAGDHGINEGSRFMRAAAGRVSITTVHWQSQPTVS
jgi:SRSO17 transposase